MVTFHHFALNSAMHGFLFSNAVSLIFRSAKKEHHEIAKIRVGVCQPYLKNKWSPENISHIKEH